MDVEGKAAVVTGGASGLGLAAARALAAAGTKVAILDLGEDRVAAAAAEFGGLGLACDVTDPSAVASAIARAGESQGAVRINVNCAGIPGGMLLVDKNGPVDMDRYAKVIAVNLLGTVSVMTKCADVMMKQADLNDDGEKGVIVNTSSITAFEGQVGQGAYAPSKGAIASLTLQAAREFAPRGVRVMSIAPGLFETPMADHVPDEVIRSMMEKSPFPRRYGRPEEYAELVLAICRNCMLNGETIRLDAAVRLEPR